MFQNLGRRVAHIQKHFVERAMRRILVDQRAQSFGVAKGCERAVNQADDLAQMDLARRTPQRISALGPTHALDHPCVLHFQQDEFEKFLRKVLFVRDIPYANCALVVTSSQHHHGLQRVKALLRDLHSSYIPIKLDLVNRLNLPTLESTPSAIPRNQRLFAISIKLIDLGYDRSRLSRVMSRIVLHKEEEPEAKAPGKPQEGTTRRLANVHASSRSAVRRNAQHLHRDVVGTTAFACQSNEFLARCGGGLLRDDLQNLGLVNQAPESVRTKHENIAVL